MATAAIIAPVADDLRADLDQLFLQARQRPILDRLRRRQRATRLCKGYVKRNKNDAADAEANCEAVTRPSMRFVPVKDVAQQSVLMLHRARNLLVRQRTMLVNALRAHLAEFGVIAPQGLRHVDQLIAAIDAERFRIAGTGAVDLAAHRGTVERYARQSSADRGETCKWHRSDRVSKLLATVPGDGIMGASAIAWRAPRPPLVRWGRCQRVLSV
jgi:transposase